MEFQSQNAPLQIPFEQLSSEALEGLIQSFILREGTDYGWREVSYEKKYEDVLKKIKNHDYVITFDAATETVTMLTRQQWNDFAKGSPR